MASSSWYNSQILLQTFDCTFVPYFQIRIDVSLYHAGYLTLHSLPAGMKFSRLSPLVSSRRPYCSLILICFKKSWPPGGSGSKMNCRSPLALGKGSLRNTAALKVCSFIYSIVFCSLFAHTSVTFSQKNPLTQVQTDLKDKLRFCDITNLAFALHTTQRECQKMLQQRLGWEESKHWERNYSENNYSWFFSL